MAGVSYDWQAPDGRTPLVAAAWKGHHQVVELLLAKGSPVNQAVVIEGIVHRFTYVGGTESCKGAVYHTFDVRSRER